MTRRRLILLPPLALLHAQESKPPEEFPIEFVCPMDPDIRSKTPGRCSRCGMKLEAGIPEHVEFPIALKTTPRVIRAGQPVLLEFRILHPKTRRPVTDFQIVHEKLFHLFLVSQDLGYFAHEHPERTADAAFRFSATFPRPGAYRLLCDFYPLGGTPQLSVRTLIVPGRPQPAAPLQADLAPKRAQNLEVEITTDPPQPICGKKTLLFLKLNPADGLEPYLGAWGHMLAASADLVDLIHLHPFLADGGPQVQFNAIFPREGMHRLWVQFQRRGVVNTVAFNVPVTALR